MYIDNFKGYDIYLSDRYPKKYYALVNGKKIYFGDARYGQYFDKLGYYKFLDHKDPVRRSNFRARHHKNKNIVGSPGWFSYNILW